MKKISGMGAYKDIPAMSPTVTHDYLKEVGRGWRSQGVAIELGSWLGGTATPLLEGLVEAGYDKPFYAYDRWKANSAEVEKARLRGLGIKEGQNLEPLFLKNTRKAYANIRSFRGEIDKTIEKYPGDPIEICVFDAPKREPIFSKVIEVLSPYWIPGVTVLGLLDYYFYMTKKGERRELFKAPVRFMEKYGEHFTKLTEWPEATSAVFFRYEKKLKLYNNAKANETI